jgi:ABC-2 type transport system permease protein
MNGVGALVPIVEASLRGSLRGLRTLALAALAAVPTLILLALVAAHTASGQLESSAQSLFGSLVLDVVVILVLLVLGVAQFRGEIEDDTLCYLTSRSVSRPVVAVGKYLGAVGAALVVLLPASLLPLAVAGAAGAPAPDAAVPITIFAVVLLAVLAYAAVFVFLGLVSRSATLLGLIFGFLWEGVLPLLPGEVPRLTVSYYLHSLLALQILSGPLSGYATVVTSGGAVAAILGATIFFLGLTAFLFRFEETAPERSSA